MILKAMSYGYLGDRENLKEGLKNIVNNYPSSEVKPQAEKTLALLSGTNPKSKKILEEIAKYEFQADKPQTAMIMIPNSGKADINKLKTATDDFNKEFFRNVKLKVSGIIYNNATQFVLVKSLQNVFKAKDYRETLLANKKLAEKFGDIKLDVLLISKKNFTTMYKGKDLEGYRSFFKVKYLSK